MTKFSQVVKDLFSQSKLSLDDLKYITPEQVRRLVVPALDSLKKEITANRKITKTS